MYKSRRIIRGVEIGKIRFSLQEDDFADDVRGYGSPGNRGDQIAAIVIPSQAPKSSAKPSGYARPEISQVSRNKKPNTFFRRRENLILNRN